MELPGPWVAAEADDEIRRNGSVSTRSDRGVDEIDVPGQWQTTRSSRRATARSCTARASTLPAPAAGRRRWVTLDGIFYQGDVWLDGAYLGDPEGYFFPHIFDITDLSRSTTNTCSPSRSPAPRSATSATGGTSPACSSSRSGSTASYNPGGLWRPVRLYDTGPVRIDRLRVLCRDADPAAPTCASPARLDSDAQRPIGDPHDGRRHPARRDHAGGGERARTTSSGASTWPTRRCGGRVRSATSR